MTLEEGKQVIDKYREYHNLYVNILVPIKTHKDIHAVLLSELKLAGYESITDFFHDVELDNVKKMNVYLDGNFTLEELYKLMEVDLDLLTYWKKLWW